MLKNMTIKSKIYTLTIFIVLLMISFYAIFQYKNSIIEKIDEQASLATTINSTLNDNMDDIKRHKQTAVAGGLVENRLRRRECHEDGEDKRRTQK